MPTLHSLLIGINDYPSSVSNLGGCVNDCQALDTYLSNYAAGQDWAYRPQVLLNEQATRQAIIDGFQHFAAAKDGDLCVWTYAGHGSRTPAPPAFWHQAPDKLHECLVCWDSREPGGRELLDKEMSWLIWQATKDKKLHFLVLMDCCFAGTNLRLEGSQNRMRPRDKNASPLALESYLGFADYHDLGGGHFSPPRGEYLQLAASRASRPAREMHFEDGAHGVFTYALLKQLKETGRPLTYGELYQRVHAWVSSLVAKQSPQLDYSTSEFSQQLFLRQEKAMPGARQWVYFDREKENWVLNMGQIDGIREDSEREASVLVRELGERVSIRKVFPSLSIIEPAPTMSRRQLYSAQIKKHLPSMLRVALAPDFPAEKKERLLAAFTASDPEYVALVDRPTEALYWVRYHQGHLGLCPLNDDQPKFAASVLPHARQFWEDVNTFARWTYLQQLSNPSTQLPSDTLRFECYQMETAVDYNNDSPKQSVGRSEKIRQDYRFLGGQWRYPAFQCKVTNTTQQTLWVGALFLSNDYGVMNGLLPKVELQAGEETWLRFHWNQEETTIIRNGINEELSQLGITRNPETIKFIASTEELFLDEYNQNGLLPYRYQDTRSPVGRYTPPRQDVRSSDWTTYDLELVTRLPLEPLPLSFNQAAQWFGHRLHAPVGFSALASLYTLEDIEEQLTKPLSSALEAAGDFTPYAWTGPFNQAPGLAVLGLEQVDGLVSPTHPLRLNFPENVPVQDLRPLAYEERTGRLIEIPHSSTENQLLLEELPVPIQMGTDQALSLIFLHYIGEE